MQLAWLAGQLEECKSLGCKVVILSHIPLIHEATKYSTFVWNADDVIQLLHQYPIHTSTPPSSSFSSFSTSSFSSSSPSSAPPSPSSSASFSGVALVIAGHDHDGGYARDSAGIHHLTLASPLECNADISEAAFAHVEVFRDRLVLVGKGKVPSLELPFSCCPLSLPLFPPIN